MAKDDSGSGQDRSKTPPKWTGPKDARPDGLKYPNYWTRKTRSGHSITYDDTKDKESITIQHRSGSMLQLMPDGALQMTTNKGKFEFVFGENRVQITGAHDVTVKGAASMKVEGDYNTTVNGNMNMAVKGDYTMTAKSMNTTVAEQMDTVAGSETKKIEGSSTTQVQGAATLLSAKGMTVGSIGDALALGAGTNLGMYAKGALAMKSDGKTSIKATGMVAVDGSQIHHNSGLSDDAVTNTTTTEATPSAKESTYSSEVLTS